MPGIDWRSIRGLGNFIRHGYDEVSDEIIWDTIHTQVPLVVFAVREAIRLLPSQDPQ